MGETAHLVMVPVSPVAFGQAGRCLEVSPFWP
jgi:hypothetical protein